MCEVLAQAPAARAVRPDYIRASLNNSFGYFLIFMFTSSRVSFFAVG